MKRIPLLLAIVLASALVALESGCGNSSADFEQRDSQWLCRLQSPDVGYVEFPMQFRREGSSIEGQSRPGVAGRYIGFFKLMLAKLFSSDFENGALIHLREGHITNDSVSAVLASALGNMKLAGRLDHDTLRATLTRHGVVTGSFVAVKTSDIPSPLRNYPVIADSAIAVSHRVLFDTSLLAQSEWRKFEEQFHSLASTSEDDVEFLFAFFYAKKLPFSHYVVFQEPRAQDTLPTPVYHPSKPTFELREAQPNTQLLTIRSFGGTSREIDSLFEVILRSGDDNLIIDLRENQGGNLSAMEVASYLSDSSYYGGAFITNLWFRTHTHLPSISDYRTLPVVTEANTTSFFEHLHTYPAITIRVIPNANRVRGRVLILTSGMTASACEPLVYALKAHHLATIVGEQTAGAMLSAEKFDLGNRWSAYIPTADYYTADGVRLEGVGVTPDIVVPPTNALDSALSMLKRR